jgi:hypothetical protein
MVFENITVEYGLKELFLLLNFPPFASYFLCLKLSIDIFQIYEIVNFGTNNYALRVIVN